MTEVAQWDGGREVAARMNVGATRLVEWAQEADAAYALAQKLTSTAFCPEQFRGKPADAAAAMLAGGELGLSPLAALGAFDVIQGRAAARAITLRALVQSRGHDLVLVESTESRCTMKGRRAGSSEWQTVRWTIDRAKNLNLTGKSNWKQQPGAMLVARATSELARLVASDAILGIGGGYSSEEYADGGPVQMAVDAETADPAPSGTRRMSRTKPAGADAPESVESAATGDGAEPVEEAASLVPDAADPPPQPDLIEPRGAQMKALHASLNEAGLGDDRDGALRFISETVGREVASSKDLTKGEASTVLDALKAITATPDADPWQETAAQVAARDEQEVGA